MARHRAEDPGMTGKYCRRLFDAIAIVAASYTTSCHIAWIFRSKASGFQDAR